MIFTRIALAILAAIAFISTAQAQCTQSEIRIFASGYCPVDFAPVQGQTLQIGQHTSLYALLGTQYGGNGSSTFALPDTRGRVIIGTGTGAGLKDAKPGQTGGQEYQVLSADQMPVHDHQIDTSANGRLRAHDGAGDTNNPTNAYLAGGGSTKLYIKNIGSGATMAPDSVQGRAKGQTDATGKGQPFSVRDPYIVLTTCICIHGTFPSRGP